MKNIVITGCSRGCGYAIAKTFLRHGQSRIIGTSTSGQSTLSNENFTCHLLSLNDEASILNFTSQLSTENIQLDGLINNAAVLLEPWNDPGINIHTLRTTIEVNLLGTIHLTEALLPMMKDNAHIMNISSNWGSFSDPQFNEFQPHYKISKAALNMYSKLLDVRLKKRNIIISSLDPGWVRTDMGGDQASKEASDIAEEVFHLFNSNIPSGQFWKDKEKREW